jgi:Dyp-type peroxidase family
MPIDLTKPLRWSDAQGDDLAMLKDLQGNILDGHGRKATIHLFLRFDENQPECARSFLRTLEPEIMSAHQQLEEARKFRDEQIPGSPFIGLLLSSSGYRKLDIAAKMPLSPPDGAFDLGMLARAGILNDPAKEDLEIAYRERLDAMILIGADPDSEDSWVSTIAENIGTHFLNIMPPCVSVVATETGRAIFRAQEQPDGSLAKKEGIEHFGYVDGRSQPLMLEELIERERDESDGISVWSPRFPIGQVLVPDPGSPASGTAFGSFFVFRKLEQKVEAFKDAEEALGNQFNLGALAGAMLVGRFEDGTPVTLQREEGADNPVLNNFDYASDMAGLRCPFHAHIRKTNPRGDIARRFVPDPRTAADFAQIAQITADERSHIMARRGMPYGQRDQVINPDKTIDGVAVGLMFMSFQQSLEDQFEFTQQSWANNPAFVTGLGGPPFPPQAGRDPIIGQAGGAPRIDLTVRDRWGMPDTDTRVAAHLVSFDEHVVHKGGEYFFAPAKSMLASL